ncbi:MAG TPA: carboxypeptidase-like regulatory domain-containing protein, partial [Chryseolinea sp.]
MERLRMIVILLMFLSESETLFCQVSIAGKIRDDDEALPSVTVLLLSGDSTLIQGVVTDSVGKFFMDRVMPGYYILSASIVGYTRFDSDIEIYGESLVLPEIILEVESTALNEVIVSGERQRFDHKTDRLVINLEGSITSSGNSVLEVLQKSPGVFVNRQNNTIAINGKTGVRVMINNKVTQLPPDAVVQMLDGMSAANVESLELITAPSSAQDAEGNGGIINIVTKVNEDFGTIASLGLMAGARWAENFGANLNVHHRGKAIAYFLDYSIILNHNLHILKSARSRAGAGFPYGETYSHRENRTTQQNLSAGFEWQVFKNIKMNLLLSGYDRNWRLSAD